MAVSRAVVSSTESTAVSRVESTTVIGHAIGGGVDSVHPVHPVHLAHPVDCVVRGLHATPPVL